jgi:cellulose synthase/poly-beta-1,6-N-acetylglucosamine synthase-like glycosyltransferase
MPFVRTPDIRSPAPSYFGHSQGEHSVSSEVPPSFMAPTLGTARSSVTPSLNAGNSTRPASTISESRQASGSHHNSQREKVEVGAYTQSMTASVDDGLSNADTLQAPTPAHMSQSKKLKKKIRRKTMEAQVLGFRAWEKPHRTDEHITPGTYRGFWIWVARCLTFYIPSFFLKKCLKMNDLRQRLAFRQKVLFCVLLAAIYGVVTYFLVIQPILSCVVKVSLGSISNKGPFCAVVRNVIYVYMGLGGVFMILVAVCVCRVRYVDRSFEEHDALLVMQIPCYNEDEATLRKTIESCVQSSYEKKRKLLFIVADGLVAAEGQKPSYKILLEDIFEHSTDLESGIENQAHEFESYDGNGVADNKAYCATGHYRGVPYVLVIKTGRDDEQNDAKPGNRGKRDSQLLAYNFFHYVNYRRFWSPLFENMEFQMKVSLNMDARDAMYMLAIDCDTEVDRTGISYLVDKLQKNHKLLGVCGYTGVSNPMSNFIASSQVFEYWLTHAVLKAVESVCLSVFVLSGCFTIYRLKWPNNRPAILHPLLLEDYAGSYDKTLHEHNLLSIGEDRYLSTLAIRYFGADCRLQYFSAATCKTVVPESLSVLLDQRRRWTNSLIHCHFAHLNVMPFEASFWTQCRLLFVLGLELFQVFILPLALPAGLALAIISVLLTPYAWAILLAFLLIPVFLCILCMDWTYIPFYLPFFPMIGMFSIVIPIFSIWNQDNIKWGKTRGG